MFRSRAEAPGLALMITFLVGCNTGILPPPAPSVSRFEVRRALSEVDVGDIVHFEVRGRFASARIHQGEALVSEWAGTHFSASDDPELTEERVMLGSFVAVSNEPARIEALGFRPEDRVEVFAEVDGGLCGPDGAWQGQMRVVSDEGPNACNFSRVASAVGRWHIRAGGELVETGTVSMSGRIDPERCSGVFNFRSASGRTEWEHVISISDRELDAQVRLRSVLPSELGGGECVRTWTATAAFARNE